MSVDYFDKTLEESLPEARTKDIIVQEADDELLVYDVENEKAHNLNETISLVWKNCDGKTDAKTLLAKLSKKLKTEIGEDFLILALAELNNAKLLKEKSDDFTFDKLSRRKILMKYALPTVMLPVIVSLIAPQSVHAQASCLTVGQSDCFVTPCCPGLSCVTAVLAAAPGTCAIM